MKQQYRSKEELIRQKKIKDLMDQVSKAAVKTRENLKELKEKEFTTSTSDSTGTFMFDTMADGSLQISAEVNNFKLGGELGKSIPKWLSSLFIHTMIKMINAALVSYNNEKKAARSDLDETMNEIAPEIRKINRLVEQDGSDERPTSSPEAAAS